MQAAWNRFARLDKEIKMKKLTGILIGLLTAFTALLGVYAADVSPAVDIPHVNAYIDEGRLVIDYSKGMADTAIIAYYRGQTLCGSYISQINGESYTFDIPKGYTKIRVWFTDEDEARTVHIIDRSSVTLSPTPSATPAQDVSSATPRPTTRPRPTEEPDEGYGGHISSPEPTHDAPAASTPAETPEPTEEPEKNEPEDSENNDNITQSFTFSVECHNALSSDALSDGLLDILPSDGFLAPAAEYGLTDGMTVYDALTAAADEYGLKIKYKSGYVSTIGGLGEFDCGPFSGWMYLVNGKAILAPVDGYVINDGDVVQMAYTCLLGRDLGQEVE